MVGELGIWHANHIDRTGILARGDGLTVDHDDRDHRRRSESIAKGHRGGALGVAGIGRHVEFITGSRRQNSTTGEADHDSDGEACVIDTHLVETRRRTVIHDRRGGTIYHCIAGEECGVVTGSIRPALNIEAVIVHGDGEGTASPLRNSAATDAQDVVLRHGHLTEQEQKQEDIKDSHAERVLYQGRFSTQTQREPPTQLAMKN